MKLNLMNAVNGVIIGVLIPLDGTKEFIKKNNEFTVNIALIHKTVPVLGVVFASF